MEHIHITTPQNVAIDFEVAGIGDRVIATIIDYSILVSYLFLVFLITGLTASRAVLMLGLIPYMTYFLLCEVFMNGQSLGKRVRNLKVVRLGGGHPSLGAYLLRWLLRFIDIDLSSGLIGLVAILVNSNGQRLGDMAAGTTVVRVKPRVRLKDTVYAVTGESHQSVYPNVERLADSDIETAREVLNTLVREPRSRVTYALGEKTKSMLLQKMATSSDQPPIEFLQTVIKDFNRCKGRV